MTRGRGDAETRSDLSRLNPRVRGTKAPRVSVAPPESSIQALEVRRGPGPRLTSLPVSPPPRVPASLRDSCTRLLDSRAQALAQQ